MSCIKNKLIIIKQKWGDEYNTVELIETKSYLDFGALQVWDIILIALSDYLHPKEYVFNYVIYYFSFLN